MPDSNVELIDAQTFLALDEQGTIRAAAKALDVPLNTFRYRLDRLEQRCGGRLFARSSAGATVTELGERIRPVARAIVEAVGRIETGPESALVHPGQLTIACSEAIGALWLTPKLDDLIARLPGLTIGLECLYDAAHDASGGADLWLSFFMPRDPNLIVSRLGTLHFMCYGARDYFERHGRPASLEDVRNHSLIEQDAPGMHAHLRTHMVGAVPSESYVRLRTNSAISVYRAVAAGTGIAPMPTWFSYHDPELEAVDLSSRLRFDLYYVLHREARDNPVIRTAVDWLKAAFDARRYPCFSDAFVYPGNFRS